MKHILLAALIALGVTPNAFAHERHGRDRDRDRNYQWEHREERGHYRHHRHRRGDRIHRHDYEYYRVIDYRDYRYYHLQPPPRGYHYVRDRDGEILLVGIATGIIIGVILSQ